MQKEFLSAGEAVGETQYGELTEAALEKLAKAQMVAIALSAAVRLTEIEAGAGVEAGFGRSCAGFAGVGSVTPNAGELEQNEDQDQLPHVSRKRANMGHPVATRDRTMRRGGGELHGGAWGRVWRAHCGVAGRRCGGEGGARCEVHAACAGRDGDAAVGDCA